MLNLNYDREFDTLYLGIADNSSSYGAEQINHINVFRDSETDEITGFVIFGFMQKYNANKLPLFPIPQNIDFENDVLPAIANPL